MTTKGSQLLCQITSPLGGWWGREPSLGRVRLTLWSARAGGAARDMWRNWSWCSFVCCLLPPATLLVASCPRRRTMGPPSSAFSGLLTTVQRRRRRTARWRESTTHPYCGAAVHQGRRPWDLLGHISDQQNGHRLGFYVNLAKKMDVW